LPRTFPSIRRPSALPAKASSARQKRRFASGGRRAGTASQNTCRTSHEYALRANHPLRTGAHDAVLVLTRGLHDRRLEARRKIRRRRADERDMHNLGAAAPGEREAKRAARIDAALHRSFEPQRTVEAHVAGATARNSSCTLNVITHR
jgi:hypothetical protein